MSTRSIVLCIALLRTVVAAVGAAGQEQQEKPIDVGSYEHVAQVFSVKPRVGMDDKFEQAMKEYFRWVGQQNETWTWTTSQIMTGEDYGGYEIATYEHRWKDFDEHAQLSNAERLHWNETVAPFTEKITCSFLKGLPEVSFTTPQDPPPLYRGVKFVHVKLDRVPEFRQAMRKQQEAIVKTKGLPGSEWYQMVRGRVHPLYIWVIPMQSMAELEPPTGGNRPELVVRAFGPEEAQKILTQLNSTVESYHGEIYRIRPDLSYTPPKR